MEAEEQKQAAPRNALTEVQSSSISSDLTGTRITIWQDWKKGENYPWKAKVWESF